MDRNHYFFSVKETAKTVWYTSVVLAGVSATAVILYLIFKELLSTDSPEVIYSKALEKCKNNPRVCDLLGEPIKAQRSEHAHRRRGSQIKYSWLPIFSTEFCIIFFPILGTGFT